MVEAATLVVVALLVAGVVGSVLPILPGAVLSLVGLLGYAFVVGTGEIWWGWLALLAGAAALAAVFDVVATTVAARRGGSTTRAATAGLVVGVALTLPLGPLGLFGGIAGTVFLAEYRRGRSPRESATAAGYATAGVLASGVAQVAITGFVLVAFLVLLVV